MKDVLLIAAFGVLGVLGRYGVDQLLAPWNKDFPISTLLINGLGCLFAGSILAIAQYRDISSSLQTSLLVGFCGGFTTFSAYALQSVLLLERGKVLPAATYFIINPMIGIFMAYLPMLILRRMH